MNCRPLGLLLLALAPLSVLLASCGGGSNGPVSAPVANVNHTTLSFNSQLVGAEAAAQAVTVSNTGDAALTISEVSLTGTDSAMFAETNTCTTSVAAGESCTVSVTFTPSSAGAKSASLNLSTNAASSPTVALSGTGRNATYTAKSGVAQKGPLVLGSTVTAQELDASLSPTGSQFSYQTNSDLGTFSPTSTFTTPYIGLIATGYYFDEVVNATSTGTVTLNGYSDLSLDSVLNVNLLTTLTYQRIQNLVTTDSKPFDAARAQAESEVLTAFNIPAGSYSAFGTFSTLDLAADNDGSHILAALSSIFVNGNSAGPLSALIAKVQNDIGKTGVIDATTASALATSAQSINPATIAGNLSQEYVSVGVTFTATDLSNWIDQNGDGLIGLFRFPVRLATPASVFTFPDSVVAQLVGTSASAVTVSAGQLSITTSSGAKETAAIQASDVITVTPGPAGLPNGVLNSYLMNGANNVALAIFSAQPSWHQAGDLPTMRTQQTATLLSNGQVLVAGGLNPTPTNIFIAAAELYNPTGTWWSPAGQLAMPRDGHTATLLANGQVLVAGGVNLTGFVTTSELYNPATNAWSAAPSLATQRTGHTASLLPNGNVLVVGGISSGGTLLASAELYNPVSNTWSTAANLATARALHSATVLSNGDVLVVGGQDADGITFFASAELYDPVANTWSPAGTLATARDGHTATLLPNGFVLVAGGIYNCSTCGESSYLASAELYNPATNSWSTVATMTTAREGHTATLLSGGTVLVTGGTTQNVTSQSVGSPVTATTEIYDPVANTWTLAATMSTPRVNHSANLLSSGAVLVEGGETDTAALASAEYYW